jgi:hypothetical protein
MKATILLIPFCALFGACNIHQHHPVPVPEYSKEYVLRTPKGKVTEPADLEAYPVARYQDPCNKDIMHEKHFVYRRQAPRWKLNSSPTERVYLGEAAGVRSGKPIVRTAESSVTSSRELTAVKEQIHALSANQRALGDSQLAIMQTMQQRAEAPTNREPSNNSKPENVESPRTYKPE